MPAKIMMDRRRTRRTPRADPRVVKKYIAGDV